MPDNDGMTPHDWSVFNSAEILISAILRKDSDAWSDGINRISLSHIQQSLGEELNESIRKQLLIRFSKEFKITRRYEVFGSVVIWDFETLDPVPQS